MNASSADPRRQLPSVEALLQAPALARWHDDLPHGMLVELARVVLAEERALVGQGAPPREVAALAAVVAEQAAAGLRPTLHPLINATGVVLHTNLGRAPLSPAALAAVSAVAAGYCNLEYDEESGRRGSRHVHAERLICRVTGAEAACVVNNCAAALVLVLAALARRREVLLSRGQAVEIGGGFRVPEVMRQSGARLVDVGTTNRTRSADYAAAITPRTAILLRVHRSNFRMQGFVEDTPLSALVDLARGHDLVVVDDLGSGCLLDVRPLGLDAEPTVQESIAAGADLVVFSGDKLLGGPQAGIIAGRASLVDRVRRHSLMRALRVDKMTLAALQATLLHYLQGEALTAIPVWRMMSASTGDLRGRAEAVAATVAAGLARMPELTVGVEESVSAVGGGTLPGQTLPTAVVALARPGRGAGGWAQRTAAALRAGDPPLVARVEDDRLLCDLRTVLAEGDGILAKALVQGAQAALSAGQRAARSAGGGQG